MEHLQQMLRVYLAKTDYDAYVRSDCGGGDKSDWSSVVSFTTTYADFYRYSENFDGVNEPNIPNAGIKPETMLVKWQQKVQR